MVPAFTIVFDAAFKKSVSDAVAWFDSIVSLPEFVKSCGNIKVGGEAKTYAA